MADPLNKPLSVSATISIHVEFNCSFYNFLSSPFPNSSHTNPLGYTQFILPHLPSAIAMAYRREHVTLSAGQWDVFPISSVCVFMKGHVTQDWTIDCEQCLLGKFSFSWKLHQNASSLIFAKQCCAWMFLLELLVGGVHWEDVTAGWSVSWTQAIRGSSPSTLFLECTLCPPFSY